MTLPVLSCQMTHGLWRRTIMSHGLWSTCHRTLTSYRLLAHLKHEGRLSFQTFCRHSMILTDSTQAVIGRRLYSVWRPNHSKLDVGFNRCQPFLKPYPQLFELSVRQYCPTSEQTIKAKFRGIQKDVSPLTTKRIVRRKKTKDSLAQDKVRSRGQKGVHSIK